MEVKIARATDGYVWTITDDLGAVIEMGVEEEKEVAVKSAEIAMSWIQIGGVY